MYGNLMLQINKVASQSTNSCPDNAPCCGFISNWILFKLKKFLQSLKTLIASYFRNDLKKVYMMLVISKSLEL